MNTFKLYQAVLLWFLFSLAAWAAEEEVRERVYLQTDKDFYLSGETLWLKMYLTDVEGRPSSFSRIGYAELVGEEGTGAAQVKLSLRQSSGWGELLIPPTLPSGCYRLVGYTRQMRNEGEAVYFSKIIQIYNAWTASPHDRVEEWPAPDKPDAAGNPSPSQASSERRADEGEALSSATQLPTSVPSTLRITTDRPHYRTRSLIRLRVEGIPSGADLALSITRLDSLPTACPTDMLQWKRQLGALPRLPLAEHYTPEYEGMILSGSLLPATGTDRQPPTDASSTLPLPDGVQARVAMPGGRIRLFSGQIAPDRTVHFYADALEGVHEVVATVESSSAAAYRIDLESGFAAHTAAPLPRLRLGRCNEAALQERSMALQTQYLFATDTLSATSLSPAGNLSQDIPDTEALSRAGQPDYGCRFTPVRSYKLDEYVRFKTVGQTFTEFILGVQIRKIAKQMKFCVRKEEKQGFNDGNTLVLLDGIPLTDHEVMLRYNPYRLSQIDIYTGTYVFGNRVYEGIIAFYTPRHRFPELRLPAGSQLLDYKGTAIGRLYKGRAYDTEELRGSRLPDFRHTLYWNPSLKGIAPTIEASCYASDLEGEYLITVEGLAPDGQPVHGCSTCRIYEE